mmetsp:Transcript_20459/g.62373  ORF Transcript_20459/g.62373 Transcript_20459/m.62373 type:complete len:254 (-) Transcript_20459:1210-1971(-)
MRSPRATSRSSSASPSSAALVSAEARWRSNSAAAAASRASLFSPTTRPGTVAVKAVCTSRLSGVVAAGAKPSMPFSMELAPSSVPLAAETPKAAVSPASAAFAPDLGLSPLNLLASRSPFSTLAKEKPPGAFHGATAGPTSGCTSMVEPDDSADLGTVQLPPPSTAAAAASAIMAFSSACSLARISSRAPPSSTSTSAEGASSKVPSGASSRAPSDAERAASGFSTRKLSSAVATSASSLPNRVATGWRLSTR